ncbi:hypothetical protein BGZ83_003062 [Gryganskiella cystojenkinii]|nr:hypothetical protein BGZ83_003062 [Gryganskiella cystojenkinii]
MTNQTAFKVYAHEDLHLIQANSTDMITKTWTNNKEEWGKTIDMGIYLARERILSSLDFTANDKLQVWVLVPKSFDPENPDLDQIISALETFKRPGLVATKQDGVKEVLSVSIASVFTPEHYRGHGYASLMMRLLWKEIEKMGASFTFLYSDVGTKFYGCIGWAPMRSDQMVIPTSHSFQSTTTAAAGAIALDTVTDANLPEITLLDAQLLRETLSIQAAALPSDSHKVFVAVTPEPSCVGWLHTRSRFVAQHIRPIEGNYGIVKLGAKDKDSDSFVLWFHDLVDKVLFLIRWRIDPNAKDPSAVAREFIKVCQVEAEKCQLTKVVIWNPDQSLSDLLGLPIEHRTSAIPSLGLTPLQPEVPVEWVMNEKFYWC